MIGIVDVEVQAANPQMPLCPFVAFVGSPSSVRVRNVPGNVGSWNITKVYVSANYPDNSIQSRECTRVGEIYVGTLPACNAVGKGANGFVVSADGVDESGNAVTGYVLGKGDLEILDADGAITPGVTTHYVHGLDEQPSDPHEYDIYKDGDTWKIYFDGAWGSLAPALTLDDAVTPASANGVKSSGIWAAIWGALSALPAGFASLYDWVISKLSEYRDKLDLAVYGLGNATVALPDGFSIEFSSEAYTAPVGGETITFIGPVPSSNPYSPNDKFYYPSNLGTLDSFDPNNYSVWCLVCSSGGDTPDELMYKTGPSYSISGWNSAAPTLTLSLGEATGDAPTMARPIGATGDTLAKVSQMNAALAGKLDKSGGTMTGAISFDDSMPSGGPCSVYYNTDKWHFKDHMGTEIVTPTFAGGIIALTKDIPYTLVAKTISNNAVTLDDRASNAVTISATLSPNTLTVNFPTATSGKARDFGLRLTVASGVTTAPELALPQGVTCENADGEAPEIGADGAATILYFTETASGVFLVKGEVVTAIS